MKQITMASERAALLGNSDSEEDDFFLRGPPNSSEKVWIFYLVESKDFSLCIKNVLFLPILKKIYALYKQCFIFIKPLFWSHLD